MVKKKKAINRSPKSGRADQSVSRVAGRSTRIAASREFAAENLGIHDRVIKVLRGWLGLANADPDPADTDILEILFDNSGQAIPFQPDAVQNLRQKLQEEFDNPPKRTIDIPNSAFFSVSTPSGRIKTVINLVRAVVQSS